MGGTSTDVCRITGAAPAVARAPRRRPGQPRAGHPHPHHRRGWRQHRPGSTPAARCGSARVRAGAVPGPAAYGQGGTEPTVTDANLVAGHIPADLDPWRYRPARASLAREAVGRLGAAVGLGPEARPRACSRSSTATWSMRCARSRWRRAPIPGRPRWWPSVVPADSMPPALLAGWVWPGRPGAAALGCVLGPGPAAGRATGRPRPHGHGRRKRGRPPRPAQPAGPTWPAATGIRSGTQPRAVRASADVRYLGQSHRAGGPARSRLVRAASCLRGRASAALRLQPRGRAHRAGQPALGGHRRGAHDLGRPPAGRGDEPAQGREGVWQRETLPEGFVLDGPAVVVEANSTVLLEAGDRLTVLEDGTLEIVS